MTFRPSIDIRRTAFALVSTGFAASLLTACGSSDSPGSPGSADGTPAAHAATHAATIAVEDAWIKVAAAGGTTAAFGTIRNDTDKQIVVVSAATTAAMKVELHEVADVNGTMTMRAKQGGFVVAPDSAHELKPGGDHIMMMKTHMAIRPGDTVPITLTLSDGHTVSFTAVAKDFAGANETYRPSTSPSMLP